MGVLTALKDVELALVISLCSRLLISIDKGLNPKDMGP
ncbi:hypothetical protein COLO4_13232 [Corchorus olitorius]|uniref:Uncharacterized protein n=1 Tax=Corchorus olitorius TaxID=93759 RepID=A0A1R3JXF8_9ROSI|nr:hypothetical protein COLO4_13232 [Corchorus olitorius]